MAINGSSGMYSDETIKCANCGKDFVFSVADQERYERLELVHKPKRCEPCRAARRGAPMRTDSPSDTYPIACSKCGRADTVPFAPTPGRPVYCKTCHVKGIRQAKHAG